MGRIRVLFFGTPDFAIPSLTALAQDCDIEVTGVVTNLDRPAGRGMDLQPPSVKISAQGLGISVFQTDTLKKDVITPLLGDVLDVDIAVVVACGFFIPKWLRDRLPFGAINLHPSLLPELRGAAPVNWALIRGYEKTGITIFKLVKEMDAGPILYQEEVEIGATENAGLLLERLSVSSATLVVDTIKQYFAGKVALREQDENRVTHAPKITREICGIDWTKTSREIYNLYRGVTPRPGVHFNFGGGSTRVVDMSPVSGEERKSRYGAGEVIGAFGDCLRIACGEGAVNLGVVRPHGKGDMSGTAFARGRKIVPGAKIE